MDQMLSRVGLGETVCRRQRLLVIRRDNIGDLVCTTPAIAALRKNFPDAEIGVLVNSYNVDVLHGNPNCDRVFVYEKIKHAVGFAKRFSALLKRLLIILRLRFWAPDVTILAKAGYDKHGLVFARQAAAKKIIGFAPVGHSLTKTMLPDIAIPAIGLESIHEVEAINKLLEPLGVKDGLGPLQVFPDASMVFKIANRLPSSAKRIALHISAREAERRWGNENFLDLAKYILNTYSDTQILLLWSPGQSNDPRHPGDDEAAKQIRDAFENHRIVLVPTNSLTELIATLALCDIFVGVDGGAMHIAVALKKNVIAMFENRPEKVSHWYPWGGGGSIIKSVSPDCSSVSSIKLTQMTEAFDANFKAY